MKTRELRLASVRLAVVSAAAALLVACVGTVVDHKTGAVPGDEDDDGAPGEPDARPDDGPPDASLPVVDGEVVPGEPDAAPGEIHDVAPRLVPGGGVTDAPIGGELNVHVVDARTGAPIVGASVRLGDAASSAPLTGTTDASGLAVLASPTLAGAQTVTASAAGHGAATWIGVAGANVTIPLSPTAAPPTASARGTIAGWAQLPAPPSFNDYNLAIVLYTFLDDLNAAENSIAQPTSNGTPTNTCLRTAISDSCAWRMNTRVGEQVHYAVIVRGNTNGTTNDQTDDTYTLLGYAVGARLTMTAGQSLTGESLAMVPAGNLAGLQVTFAAAPAGLSDVVAIPMIDLGAAGRVMLPLPTVKPGATAAKVPGGGVFAGGSTEVVSMATPPGEAAAPFALAFARDVAGATASPAAFPAPPTGLSAGGGTYGFQPMAGAGLHVGAITSTDGKTVHWSVVVLDGTTTFNLPPVTPDPLPAGSLKWSVTGTGVDGFDPAGFAMPDVTARFTRAAGDSVSFTR